MTTQLTLCPELDKLRNKDLSFGCITTIWTVITKDWEKTMDGDWFIFDDYPELNEHDILGHPITWWRLDHLSDLHWSEQINPDVTLDEIQEQYDTIHLIEIRLTQYFAKDKTEIERMQHEKRPELKSLLTKFQNILYPN